MANRRFEMYEYRQVIIRMRLGESDRAIAQTALMGRKKARRVAVPGRHYRPVLSLGGGLVDV